MSKLIEEINKKAGGKVMFRPGDAPHRPKFRIPFSSPTLNRLTGGGILVPRITHLYGPPSVYKSTGIYDLIANAQQVRESTPSKLIGKAKHVALIDTEQSFSEQYLKKCGIDVNDPQFVIVDSFKSADHLVDIMVDMFKTGEFLLLCLDSLTTMLSEREDETAMSDMIKLPGWTGKFTSGMFKKLHAANKGTTAMVFANQIRDDVGSQMDRARANKSGYSPTGGHAPKFYASDVIELRKQTEETEAQYSKINAPHGFVQRRRFTGNIISARVEKTRSSGNENMELFFRYIPETGRADREMEIVNLAQLDGLLYNRGAHYYLKLPGGKEERIAQGFDNVRFKLVKDRKLYDKMLAAVEAKSKEIGAVS